MKNKILVTGGSGMVGKSLKDIMPDAIYLSSKDFDLTKEFEVIRMYDMHKPTHVIHLAAKVGGIIDNIKYPANYFDENILMNTHLVKWAHEFKVKRFIGILSTCIYPDKVDKYPMTEEMLHLGPPTPTNFSYGYSKRCLAVQIDAYNKQHNLNYNYLIPCNLYGEYDKYGDNSHFVAALISKIINAKKNNEDHIKLFGSGKPMRQFMYSGDLARIIKYIIDNNCYESFNVATPENYSIDKIARIALKACDAEYLKIKYDSTKPDGQYRKDVSTQLMNKVIPDFQFTTLYDGIKNTYNKLTG